KADAPGQKMLFHKRLFGHLFAQHEWREPVRYEKSPDEDGKRWLKLGGATVQVDSEGEIEKGCEGLHGHNLDELEETQEYRARKQKVAEQKGWESANTK